MGPEWRFGLAHDRAVGNVARAGGDETVDRISSFAGVRFALSVAAHSAFHGAPSLSAARWCLSASTFASATGSALRCRKRVVVIYNTDQPDRLVKNLRRIHGCGATPEVVSTSHALNDKLGQSLPVLESPIELSPFLAMSRVQKPRNRVFTVGRLSRDDVSKHHREDPELYRHLAESGCRVRIMGGTCLAAAAGRCAECGIVARRRGKRGGLFELARLLSSIAPPTLGWRRSAV